MKTDEFDEYHKYYDFSKSLEDMHNKMYLGKDNDEPLQEGEEYLEMESGGESEGEDWEDVDGEEQIEEEDEEEDEEEGEGEIQKAKGEKGEETEEGADKRKKSTKRVIRYKVRKVKVLDSGEIQLPNGKM